jgi:O-acetyl-ADP-ribose deacetylase (regulator of RNase III)
MEIVVQNADPFAIEAEAMAYAGTTAGTMDDALGERLLSEAGDELLEAALDTAPIAVGAATVIEVSGLEVDYIIYSPVVAEQGDRITVENVRRCTRAALVAACARHLESLILPAISPATDDMSQSEAARAMIDELRGYRADHHLTVYLVHENARIIDSLNRVFDAVR